MKLFGRREGQVEPEPTAAPPEEALAAAPPQVVEVAPLDSVRLELSGVSLDLRRVSKSGTAPHIRAQIIPHGTTTPKAEVRIPLALVPQLHEALQGLCADREEAPRPRPLTYEEEWRARTYPCATEGCSNRLSPDTIDGDGTRPGTAATAPQRAALKHRPRSREGTRPTRWRHAGSWPRVCKGLEGRCYEQRTAGGPRDTRPDSREPHSYPPRRARDYAHLSTSSPGRVALVGGPRAPGGGAPRGRRLPGGGGVGVSGQRRGLGLGVSGSPGRVSSGQYTPANGRIIALCAW